jgi:hypothetical protein
MGTNRDRDEAAALSSFRFHGEGNAIGEKDKAPIVNGLGPTRVHGVRGGRAVIFVKSQRVGIKSLPNIINYGRFTYIH